MSFEEQAEIGSDKTGTYEGFSEWYVVLYMCCTCCVVHGDIPSTRLVDIAYNQLI